MKKIFACIGLFLAYQAFSEDFETVFWKHMEKEKYDTALEYHLKWEKAEPKNPDMFIAGFNLFIQRNMKVVPTVGQMPDGRYGIYPKKEYDLDDLIIAISYLDRALIIYPNRLDIHCGRTYSLLESGLFKEGSDSFIKLLDQSKKNNNNWLWAKNESLKSLGRDAEEELISVSSDYLLMLINLFPDSMDCTDAVVKKLLLYYPDNIRSLNLSSRYYSMAGNNAKAIELLKKARAIDPKDYIILFNLAYLSEAAGDISTAIDCYEILSKFDIPEIVQEAKNELQRLKK